MKILANIILSSILGYTFASTALADAQQQLFKLTYTLQAAADVRVLIQNVQTGEVMEEGQISESESGFLVPAGEYRVTGQGYFCGVSEQFVQVSADTNLELAVWCE